MKRETQKTSNTRPVEVRGEASNYRGKGEERGIMKRHAKSPSFNDQLMEEILDRENLKKALRKVQSNKGCAGVDGVKVDDLKDYLWLIWPEIKEQLLTGKYKPSPVKRVEIPKPNGGVRKLGIPTVLDRFIQQAVAQVMQKGYDPTFSERSYGFRPKRSAKEAILESRRIQIEGYTYVVDLDLEKFFDRVNHDRLMGKLAKDIKDKRVLKLIRAFLNAGIMEKGVKTASTEGTPQGGPISPLLSNIVLDELDKELEKRGHRFVRYADDCNIYVKSLRAGQRVMESITKFIEKRLKLKVNEKKSSVTRPTKAKFLGYSFYASKTGVKIIVAPQSIKRLKDRVRELTKRMRGRSAQEVIGSLRKYLQGWLVYFELNEIRDTLKRLEGWIRRRIRCYIWKQWKTAKNRREQLEKHGVSKAFAATTAASGKGAWRISSSQAMSYAITNRKIHAMGLPRLVRK